MLRLAVLVATIALTLPAMAEPLTAIQTARLSTQLYFEGMARGDAVLVLAAARLRKPIGFQGNGAEAPLGWAEMLDAATELAGDDAPLLGLIEDTRFEGEKGMASGPFYNIANLRPGGADSYPAASFRGGTYAEAYVEAQAETDLNISVYDAAGNLICADTDPSPIAYCGWRPAATGDYVLKVENLGPGDATYSLMTN